MLAKMWRNWNPGIFVCCWWEFKMVQLPGKIVSQFLKTFTMKLPCDLTFPLPGRNSKEMKRCSYKHLYRNADSTMIQNSQKVETTKVIPWMKNINLIWPYNGMLLRPGPEQYGGSSIPWKIKNRTTQNIVSQLYFNTYIELMYAPALPLLAIYLKETKLFFWKDSWEFPGDPVFGTWHLHCGGWFNPRSGN